MALKLNSFPMFPSFDFSYSTTHTNACHTSQPFTPPPYAPCPMYPNIHQSIPPVYALQLCSFRWPTAALLISLSQHIQHRFIGFLSLFPLNRGTSIDRVWLKLFNIVGVHYLAVAQATLYMSQTVPDQAKTDMVAMSRMVPKKTGDIYIGTVFILKQNLNLGSQDHLPKLYVGQLDHVYFVYSPLFALTSQKSRKFYFKESQPFN